MGRPHHSCPGGHGAGSHLVDPQQFERCCRADHVDDRVVAADLVEVDLVDGASVETGFHLSQHSERGQRPGRHPFGQTRLFHHSDDVGMGAHHDVVMDGHDGPARGDPAPQDRLDVEPPSAKRQALQQRHYLVQIGTSVDQAAKRHVPGDPGEAVEPGHRASTLNWVVGSCRQPTHGSIRASAHAAPKPLSMPTTVMPAAQEACMASSAVTPSSAAP